MHWEIASLPDISLHYFLKMKASPYIEASMMTNSMEMAFDERDDLNKIRHLQGKD